MNSRKIKWFFIKSVVLLLCMTPLFYLVYEGLNDGLGANPVETIHFTLGDWALRFLCLTLLLTPLRHYTGQSWINRFRRMLGLFGFFYASLHLSAYVILDIAFSWDFFLTDLAESPYILFGVATFVLMMPLAVTSPYKIRKTMGANWKKLHRLVYPAAILAVLHYFFLVKSDLTQPVLYAAIVGMLLLWRLGKWIRKNSVITQRI